MVGLVDIDLSVRVSVIYSVSALATRFRPRCFAWYAASSARRTKFRVVSFCTREATPMLIVTGSILLEAESRPLAAKSPRNRSAITQASSREVSGSRTITGDTDPALVRSMAERGIVVLHKPVDLETLQAYMEDATAPG